MSAENDLTYHITRLANGAGVFENLVRGVCGAQAVWKPAPDKWSILEVVNHLYDEERDDFRFRLDSILHHPEKRWPPIDPPGWAVERKYNERELTESLERFLGERRKSIEWLKGLKEPRLENVYEHPQGRIRAGDLLASWVAHDLLHVRQLARLHWQYLNSISDPYKTAYAGEW
ncbi:MAG TPA: DinB family protein [Pyrinomonadaceae bacterium]|nr:DinB family protein [Pyrinomonadaceae bacterium]